VEQSSSGDDAVKSTRIWTGIVFGVVLASGISPSLAQSAIDKGVDLGPSSVPVELGKATEARKEAPFKWLTIPPLDPYGLSLSADYNVLYQSVNESPGEENAGGGVFRFYGIWTPVNRGSPDAGQLIFKVENRHQLGTDLAPNALLPTAGVAGVSGPTFSDKGFVLTNLYWRQAFADNHFIFRAGVVDVSDYVDAYGLANVWTDFNNLAFSTSPTMPAPAQGLGGAVGWMFAPNYYVIASIADANGDPHDPGDFFHSFFSVAEYFKHIEFGRIRSWEQRSADNVHITFWQVDAREQAGVGKDQGVAFSWSQHFGNWLPFLRGGYADHGVGLLQKSVSAGTGFAASERGDYIGVGANWGRAAASDVDQYTMEAYYKLQVYKRLLLVPGVQYIIDPANNPSEDKLWLVSLKMRVTF